jgi:hypothetical protein
LIGDLSPDVVLLKHFGGEVDVYYPNAGDDDLMEDLGDKILLNENVLTGLTG